MWLALAGCASRQESWHFAFPPEGTTAYQAPDGRLWVLHDSAKSPDGRYTLSYTPVTVKAGKWKELLSFAISSDDMSVATTSTRLNELTAKFDEKLTYTCEEVAGAVVLVIRSPTVNESSVGRALPSASWYYCVSYASRRGPEGETQFKAWEAMIRNWPNGLLRPKSAVEPQKAKEPSHTPQPAASAEH